MTLLPLRTRIVMLCLCLSLAGAGCSTSGQGNTRAAPGTGSDTTGQSPAGESDISGSPVTASTTPETPTLEPSPSASEETAESRRAAAEAAAAVAERYTSDRFGTAPAVPEGALSAEAAEAIDLLMGDRLRDRIFDEQSELAIEQLGASADPRVAWWLTDLLRVAQDEGLRNQLTLAVEQVTGRDFTGFGQWREVTDHLIAWDIPAPPNYLAYKRNAYLLVEPRWEPLFVDDADIDWRYLSWGGVLIDDRPFDETDVPCNCIPAADNPQVTDVAGGDEWLGDDTVVFGVEINGEARAYPRSAMEVREMVNDTLGGRDFAMPYCTLCGSAQVYFTDGDLDGFDRPVLRTSGLLIRSNKVMYDVNTMSIFDTFKGRAVSGPLYQAAVELAQHSVVTTTWSAWKQAHPDTTVLDKSVALGRPNSDLRNSRDGNGPIFPIGIADDRLGVQSDVLGVLTADGSPLAFDVDSALAVLQGGGAVEANGVTVVLDGGGVRALDPDGNDLGGHQAFWFAWSQFYPSTELWVG